MNELWYWDLRRQMAVPESDRGPDADTMGPYPTKVAAENWKEVVDARNEEWENADEEWDEWDSGPSLEGDPPSHETPGP